MRAYFLPAMAGAVVCAAPSIGATLLPTDIDPALVGTRVETGAGTGDREFGVATFVSYAVHTGFDTIGVRVYGGNTFWAPTFRSFTVPSWHNSYANHPTRPTLAAAEGPLTYIMTEVIAFDANHDEQWILDILLFKDQEQLITTRFRYDGERYFDIIGYGISTDVTYWDFTEFATVPLPGAGALGLAGLAAVGLRRRRGA
jgi:hypothetical protein